MAEIIKKSTDELLKELESDEEFTRYYAENRDQFSRQTLTEALNALLQERRNPPAKDRQEVRFGDLLFREIVFSDPVCQRFRSVILRH